MKMLLSVAAIALLLVGCSKTFDASTEESRKSSVEAMRQALPEDKRDKFQQSLMIVAMDGVSLGDIAQGSAALDGTFSSMQGMTAQEIMDKADSIVAARKEKEREQALQEIAELEKQRKDAEADTESIRKFEVTRSRFWLERERYSIRSQPKIALSLKNGTDHAVARVFATGTIATPGRSVPWLKEDFNFSISGGIEPGETYDTVLEPNMFSDWGNISPPADAVFTVTIIELVGNEDVKLLSSRRFSDSDRERLAELRKLFE